MIITQLLFHKNKTYDGKITTGLIILVLN